VKRWLAVAAILAAGAASGAPLDGKWWKNPRIARELALTPGQVDRIEEVFVRARPALIARRADLATWRDLL